MGKKPRAVPLTEEEKKSLVGDPILALKIETIADGIFKGKFEEEVGKVKTEINGKLTTLTTVVILGTVLVLIALIASTWLFMNTYQQHYLDTQAAFNDKINDLVKENAEQKAAWEIERDKMKEKQDYLEKLLLEKANEAITAKR
jgi:hypothetical protein